MIKNYQTKMRLMQLMHRLLEFICCALFIALSGVALIVLEPADSRTEKDIAILYCNPSFEECKL